MIPHKQGNPILICNKDDTETSANSSLSISTPNTVDCLQGILTVIPMQLLSLHIAEMKKLDVSPSCDKPGISCILPYFLK